MIVETLVSYSSCKQKLMSLRGHASWAKMTSPGGKLTALACHPTKKQANLSNEPNIDYIRLDAKIPHCPLTFIFEVKKCEHMGAQVFLF
jgi:hypothetical protein